MPRTAKLRKKKFAGESISSYAAETIVGPASVARKIGRFNQGSKEGREGLLTNVPSAATGAGVAGAAARARRRPRRGPAAAVLQL